MENIPTEILEKIFFAVPTYQLPLNEPWVCKRWTNIILQPQFWEHKLKSRGIRMDDKIWSILQECVNNEKIACLYYASMYQEYRTEPTPISNFILSMPKEEEAAIMKLWIISDNFDHMIMASGVLICRSHWHVSLVLTNYKVKSLSLLLKLLGARQVLSLTVRDNYAFWNFSPRNDFLKLLNRSGNKISDFQMRGCLSTIEGLPSDVRLCLSIGVNDQNCAIDPGFSRFTQPMTTLLIKAGTNISHLPNISYEHCYCFIVSGLEDSHILWMTEVVRKFLTHDEHGFLVFFDYHLDLAASENLLNSISNAGFDLENEIMVSSPTLSVESDDILKGLTDTLWPNCHGGFYVYRSNERCISELAGYSCHLW